MSYTRVLVLVALVVFVLTFALSLRAQAKPHIPTMIDPCALVVTQEGPRCL